MNRKRALIIQTAAVMLLLAPLALTAGCKSDAEIREEEREATISEILEDRSTLLRDLASYDAATRNGAIRRVKELGREQGRALVLHLLMDPHLENYRVEVVLARVLADWKDKRAIPYLLQFLPHPDRGVALYASQGLLVFGGDPQITAALGELLESEVVAERQVAAETLSRVDAPEVLKVCLRHYETEEDESVRAALLMPFLQSRHPERKRVLVTALGDDELAIRELAWGALQDYPDLPRSGYSPRASEVERAKAIAVLELWLRGRLTRAPRTSRGGPGRRASVRSNT